VSEWTKLGKIHDGSGVVVGVEKVILRVFNPRHGRARLALRRYWLEGGLPHEGWVWVFGGVLAGRDNCRSRWAVCGLNAPVNSRLGIGV